MIDESYKKFLQNESKLASVYHDIHLILRIFMVNEDLQMDTRKHLQGRLNELQKFTHKLRRQRMMIVHKEEE